MSTLKAGQTLHQDDKHNFVDGKAKRMQGFLKKIAKSKNNHKAPVNTPSKTENEKHEKEKHEKESKPESEEERLKKLEKDVKSALTYYKVILTKGFIQKLPGTATAVLESIINAEETIDQCLQSIFKMKEFELEVEEVHPLKEKLHRSITHLVRLSDDVLFDSYLHVRVDDISALKAADAVSMSLGLLYEFVLPRIKKFSVNAELLKCCASHHSSSNSLDDLDNLPEAENLENNHTQNSSRSKVDPPPKPFLPNGNRSFYGNTQLRKSISSNVDVNSPVSRENSRPNSHAGTDFNYLDPNEHLSSPCSTLSSRTSLSTISNSSLNSPMKFSSTSSGFFGSGTLTNSSSNELLDDPEMCNDTMRRKIKSLSKNYEQLAKSTMSLFNADEDLLSPTPEEGEDVPALPKKRQKHTAETYLQIVGGYHNERPSSMYDNLSMGNLSNIKEDEFVRGDGLPKLPPKQRLYEHRGSIDAETSSLKSSQVIKRHRNSRRESSAAYEEDNVPALDCKDVFRLLYFKKEDDNKDPVLCGGTIDALIVYATQVQTEDLYYKAFLATYRTFISPAELICKLLYRANRFQDKSKKDSPVATTVLMLLVKVMEEMFEELDKSLFDQLRSQVHRLLNIGELALGKSLRDKIVNYCIKLQSNHLPTYQPVHSSAELFDFKSFEIAQQMCLLDGDNFIKIELPEVLRWGKEQSETLSPNLSRFIGHFNSMSFWVRTMILKETRQQEREKMYKKFLKIMRILKRLNNFSSFLAILSALDSTPVRRLEWPKQYTELLAEDCKLIDSSSGFKAYRESLSAAVPPCIPYLGLILTDITFVHLGNPHELQDGKINFVKRWQQFNILDSVRRFKEKMYDFERNEKILDFFNQYEDHMDEDQMWEQSLVLHPRGGK